MREHLLGRAVEAFGAYQSIELEDGAAAEALLAVFGSWPSFCEMEEGPALALKRQEFMAAYRQAVRRKTEARRLPGICESDGTYPGAELALRVWKGRIGRDGRVMVARDAGRLAGGDDGEKRTALPEAGTKGTGEGESGA